MGRRRRMGFRTDRDLSQSFASWTLLYFPADDDDDDDDDDDITICCKLVCILLIYIHEQTLYIPLSCSAPKVMTIVNHIQPINQ
jgi:hypothetical protein